jgi:hypothetical protein
MRSILRDVPTDKDMVLHGSVTITNPIPKR